MQHNSGLITASVFAMLLAGVVSGGVVGLIFGGVLTSQIMVAFICAFFGAVLALVIGHAILGRDARFALPSGFWSGMSLSLYGWAHSPDTNSAWT